MSSNRGENLLMAEKQTNGTYYRYWIIYLDIYVNVMCVEREYNDKNNQFNYK